MKGYVAKKGDHYYAVIYEGVDPITGRERHRWHPAGPDRSAAEALANKLADAAGSGEGEEVVVRFDAASEDLELDVPVSVA